MRRKGHGLFLKSSAHLLLLSKTRVRFSCHVAGFGISKNVIFKDTCVLRYILANAIPKRAIWWMHVFVLAPLRARPITFENSHEPSIMFFSLGFEKLSKPKDICCELLANRRY
jgi:hypothetical protein